MNRHENMPSMYCRWRLTGNINTMLKKNIQRFLFLALPLFLVSCTRLTDSEITTIETKFASSSMSDSNSATSAQPPRKIHVGDVTILHVVPGKEFEKDLELTVNLDGEILVPLVGWVKVENLTTPEAEGEIRKRLDKDYLVNPSVSVRVKETNSRAVVLLGQLKKPGTYEFGSTGKMTLLEAVAKAEGFTDIANLKNVKVVRTGPDGQQTIKVNAEKVLSGEAADVELQEGDLVTVPESIF